MKATIARRAVVFILATMFTASAAGAADARLSGYTRVAERGSLVLLANLSDCGIALVDTADGTLWFSNPPDRESDPLAMGVRKMQLSSRLVVTYASGGTQTFLTNDFVSSVKPENFTATRVENGIRFDFDFGRSAEQFRIPVEFTLGAGFLSARIIASEIEEYGSSRILTITLLPFFGAGGQRDEGYILVPDGSGALIRFNNGRYAAAPYQEYVYGRDPVLSVVYNRTVRQRIHLPVFGVKKGAQAFLAVITAGEYLARIEASVSGSGSGYNSAACSFRYRESDNVILAEADWSAKDVTLLAEGHSAVDAFEVRYYPLAQAEADWPGMASRYRRFLQEEAGVHAEGPILGVPLQVDLYGAIKKDRSILGIPLTVVQVLTTFREAAGILARLRESGVDDIVVSYHGWTRGGEHDRVPAALLPERRLGGVRGFQDFLRSAREAGVEVYPDADLLEVYRSGNGYFRSFVAARTVMRAPAAQFEFRLSTYAKNTVKPFWYLLSPLRLAGAAGRFATSFRAFSDATGPSVGLLGMMVYSDFKRRRVVDRQSAGAVWTDALASIRRDAGPILVRDANAYALPFARRVSDAPLYSSRFDVADEEIPFYPMVLHGLIPYAGPAINLASDMHDAVLRTVEYGAGPAFTWAAAEASYLKETDFDNLFSAPYEPWLEEAGRLSRRMSDELRGAASAPMVSHERLAEGVYETVYAEGTRVVVNYNRDARTIRGVSVPGKDWVVLPGGAP